MRPETEDTALRLAIEYFRVSQWCVHSEASRDAAKSAIRCCATALHVYTQFNDAVERVSKEMEQT